MSTSHPSEKPPTGPLPTPGEDPAGGSRPAVPGRVATAWRLVRAALFVVAVPVLTGLVVLDLDLPAGQVWAWAAFAASAAYGARMEWLCQGDDWRHDRPGLDVEDAAA